MLITTVAETKQLHNLDKQQGETLEKYFGSPASAHKAVGIEDSLAYLLL